MLCSSCGAVNPSGSRFCMSCGSSLESATDPAPAGSDRSGRSESGGLSPVETATAPDVGPDRNPADLADRFATDGSSVDLGEAPSGPSDHGSDEPAAATSE